MSSEKTLISVVCKIANEEATVMDFTSSILYQFDIAKSKNINCLLIYILDKFNLDRTRQIIEACAIEDARVTFFYSEDTKTLVDSDILAYRKGIESKSDWVVDINAGFRHQPEDLQPFFDLAVSGQFDAICGARFQKNGHFYARSLQRRVLSRAGTVIGNLLLGLRFNDLTSGFIMFRREILIQILSEPLKSRYHFLQTELKWRLNSLTTNYIEIPILYRSDSGPLKARVIVDSVLNLFRLMILNVFGKLRK